MDLDGAGCMQRLHTGDPEIVRQSYLKMKIQSRSRGETKDCSVISMAIILDKSYNEVHSMFARCGRRFRTGTDRVIGLKVLYEFGINYRCFGWDDINEMTKNYGSTITFKNVSPLLSPHSRYLVKSDKHVAAFINGSFRDWSANTEREVASLIELFP